MNALEKSINGAITKAGPQFASTIAKYQWALVPDSQLHAAKLALTKSDYIMKIAAGCPNEVQDSIIKAGILGVDLTEGKRQAYLLPRKNQSGNTVIQLQVGYKGVEAIHQRMGVIDRLSIRVVRENDEFEWSGDDQEKPIHNPGRFKSDEDRGKIEGAFSITYFPDKSIQVVMASISEIYEKHRDLSDSWKSYQQKKKKGEWCFDPPWVTHEKAMIEKTMAYIASKQWPANYRDPEVSSNIISTLHEVDTSDYVELNAGYTTEQKEIFDLLVENCDSLGIWCFSRYVGQDVYSNLYNSGKKGEKCKLKSKCQELEKVGFSELQVIKEASEANNYSAASEIIEGTQDITKKLLLKIVDVNDIQFCKDVISSLQSN